MNSIDDLIKILELEAKCWLDISKEHKYDSPAEQRCAARSFGFLKSVDLARQLKENMEKANENTT